MSCDCDVFIPFYHRRVCALSNPHPSKRNKLITNNSKSNNNNKFLIKYLFPLICANVRLLESAEAKAGDLLRQKKNSITSDHKDDQEPIDWKPQENCYFCVDGKLLTVNDKGDLVAESGSVNSEPELANRVCIHTLYTTHNLVLRVPRIEIILLYCLIVVFFLSKFVLFDFFSLFCFV